MSNINLANNSTPKARVFTLAGVKSAELRADLVVGRWNDEIKPMFGSTKVKALIAEFANWPATPSKILSCIKRYGPLSCAARAGTPKGGETFSETVTTWRESQREFQRRWEKRNILVYAPSALDTSDAPHNLIHLSHRGGIAIQVGTLYWLLTFELFLLPQERTRKCQRPGCENPYFIAHHLKQRYCSDTCAAWAQKKWKADWWSREGERWRAARTKQRDKKGMQRGKRAAQTKTEKTRKARTK